MQQESGGNPNAMSPVGARGLLQLMPASFAWIMGIANWGQDISHMDRSFIFDPSTNLRAGIRFLGAVLEEQGGNLYPGRWRPTTPVGGVVNLWRYKGLTEIPRRTAAARPLTTSPPSSPTTTPTAPPNPTRLHEATEPRV